MDISIENKKGSIRKGTDPDGNLWETKFKFPYGYIRGSIGTDGDHVDCYIGPNKKSEKAFVIAQNFPNTGKYDEDKVMLGFNSGAEAKKAYDDHYDKKGFFGAMKQVSVDDLKELIISRKGKRLCP